MVDQVWMSHTQPLGPGVLLKSASGSFQRMRWSSSALFFLIISKRIHTTNEPKRSWMGQEASWKRAWITRTSEETATTVPHAQLWDYWPGSSFPAAGGDSLAWMLVLDRSAFSPGSPSREAGPSFASTGFGEGNQLAAKAAGAGGWKRCL